MTALVWDQAGERRYQTGVDRGVLYPTSGGAVPWNGLVGVNEITGRETKPYYIDGIKFLDHNVPGSYAAKITAYTYPDEMDELIGAKELEPGVFAHDQPVYSLFNLSYRTGIGNDVDGMAHGYKIHVLYSLMAVLGDTTLNTVGENAAASPFEWTIFGTPVHHAGIRPTCHISVDSRRIDSAALAALEARLYGSVSVDPDFPTLSELITLVGTP